MFAGQGSLPLRPSEEVPMQQAPKATGVFWVPALVQDAEEIPPDEAGLRRIPYLEVHASKPTYNQKKAIQQH